MFDKVELQLEPMSTPSQQRARLSSDQFGSIPPDIDATTVAIKGGVSLDKNRPGHDQSITREVRQPSACLLALCFAILQSMLQVWP